MIDLHHYVAWPGESWCANGTESLDEILARIDSTDAAAWQWSARTALGLNDSTALVAMSECREPKPNPRAEAKDAHQSRPRRVCARAHRFSGAAHEDTRFSCSPNNAGEPHRARPRLHLPPPPSAQRLAAR